jgi:polyadenylate-binding protein 2
METKFDQSMKSGKQHKSNFHSNSPINSATNSISTSTRSSISTSPVNPITNSSTQNSTQNSNQNSIRNSTKLALTGHLIVDLELSNQQAIVDRILKNIPISDLLALRLSHPKCEPIIYRQYLNDKTRFEHYINSLSLYSKIKFRTYAFFNQSVSVLETRHPGKFKLHELAEKNLSSRMKRLKLNGNGSTNENTEDEEILSNSGSSDKDSGVDVNEQIMRRRIEAEKRRERDTRSIFVGNIHYQSNPDDIKLHFQTHCGEVNQVTFIKDYQSQKFKGYCFVEFCNPQSVHIAVQLSGLRCKNRELRVRSKRTNMPGMQRVTN